MRFTTAEANERSYGRSRQSYRSIDDSELSNHLRLLYDLGPRHGEIVTFCFPSLLIQLLENRLLISVIASFLALFRK